MGFFQRYVAIISILLFALGVILLLLSHFQLLGQQGVRDMLRDLGIAFCSTGLISTAYELLIRDQLLDDHEKRIKTLLDPDAQHLGIRRIFKNRDERSTAQFGLDALLDRATTEVFVYGIAPIQILRDRRHRLGQFVNAGGTLRLLLADPRGKNLLALDETLAARPQAVRGDVLTAARALQDLRDDLRQTNAEDRLIARSYDIVPPFSALGIDRDSAHGVFVVELNGVNVGDGDYPSFALERRPGGLYDVYREQIDSLWNRATPFQPISGADHVPLIERGIAVGSQSELYTMAKQLCAERDIKKAVYLHYSGQLLFETISELLHNGVEVDLYVQAPQTAEEFGVSGQAPRITDSVNLLKRLDAARKSRLAVWESGAPHTVRAGIFGEDDFIILGWYVYAALQSKNAKISAPELAVLGHSSFGVLIESFNPAFRVAKEFLLAYRDGLGAEKIAL